MFRKASQMILDFRVPSQINQPPPHDLRPEPDRFRDEAGPGDLLLTSIDRVGQSQSTIIR